VFARRVIIWFDSLTDWQRLQYVGAAILFLVACTGYLLGLGSTMIVQRVEMETAALAAVELPTSEPTAAPAPVAVAAAVQVTPSPTATPRPSPTPSPPTPPPPTQTPFSGPQLREPPAVPRSLPAAPVFVPAPQPARPTATSDRPRNVETVPSVIVPTRTPVRATTPVPTTRGTVVATARPGTPGPGERTPLPTLGLAATRAATSVPAAGGTATPVVPAGAATATARPPIPQPAAPTPTIVRTPPAR
jgi:hypothetical protein